MPDETATTIKFCSVAFGDAFLGQHRWAENWTTASASVKEKALVNATNVIRQFVGFVDRNGLPVEYAPSEGNNGDDDTDESIPNWLRKACCYEALYFLDLDNDPARPFPLGILGIIQSGTDKFSHDYEPPLFSAMCRRLLENNGGVIDDPFSDGNRWDRKIVL